MSFQGKDRFCNTLEKCFNGTGHILCHLDQGKDYNPYSLTSVTLCINRLATTVHARMISGEPLVLLALSEEQLNLFTDAQAPRTQILALTGKDVSGIFSHTLSCAPYADSLLLSSKASSRRHGAARTISASCTTGTHIASTTSGTSLGEVSISPCRRTSSSR